jgi:hypothetical protein
MRSSPSAEPAGRRGAVAYVNRRPTRSPDAGGDARAPRRCPANPRLGDALVPERGARRATGSRSIRQPPANTLPGCGRGRPRSQGVPRQSPTWRCARPRARSPQGDGEPWHTSTAGQHAPRMRARTPALPGGAPPIPDLEMRSSPSAEPAGRRGTRHTPATDQRDPRRPRSQGGVLPIPDLEIRSSPSAEPAGRPGAVAYVNRRPTRSPDAGEDARAPRRCPANPRLGGEPWHTSTAGQHAPRMRAGTPALPGGAPPIPDLEMRSSPSAEPAGRRETMPVTSLRATQPHAGEDARAPRGALPQGLGPRSMNPPSLPSDRCVVSAR